MTIKSFFANTVAEAIRDARKELGEEAMLLKSRRAPEEARHLGTYEVVFGTAAGASFAPGPVAADPASSTPLLTACSTPNDSDGIWDIPETPRQAAPAAAKPRAASANALYSKLIEMEFDERLAGEFAERVQARLIADDYSRVGETSSGATARDGVSRAISLEANRLLRRASGLEGGVAALIGPAGGGKTSAVVRLAVNCGLAAGRRVVLLAANDHRVGATGLLRQYAGLLGVEYHEMADTQELHDRVLGRQEDDLVLIDTPGYGARDMKQSEELASFLAEHEEIQKHLVLPATLKGDDLRAPVERFEAFGTDYLLFTRLDETARCGSVFSEAWASRKPVSFFTTGQQIPGDLVPAGRFDLAALLQTQGAAMASAA